MASPIARQILGATAFNAINVQTVEIFMQMSPGRPAGDVRGINAANFQVRDATGAVIQIGVTPATGRIQMRIPGGVATLELLDGGAAVAAYTVRIRNAAAEGVATLDGVRRRLRMLGYQIGHTGAEGNGVDGAATPSVELDRAILEFQSDTPAINAAGNANAMDSIQTGAATQNALTAAAGV
jgi:hypothetical protein